MGKRKPKPRKRTVETYRLVDGKIVRTTRTETVKPPKGRIRTHSRAPRAAQPMSGRRARHVS
jgi:hypothetical protein